MNFVRTTKHEMFWATEKKSLKPVVRIFSKRLCSFGAM